MFSHKEVKKGNLPFTPFFRHKWKRVITSFFLFCFVLFLGLASIFFFPHVLISLFIILCTVAIICIVLTETIWRYNKAPSICDRQNCGHCVELHILVKDRPESPFKPPYFHIAYLPDGGNLVQGWAQRCSTNISHLVFQ